MTNQNDKGPMLDDQLDEVSGGLIAIIAIATYQPGGSRRRNNALEPITAFQHG